MKSKKKAKEIYFFGFRLDFIRKYDYFAANTTTVNYFLPSVLITCPHSSPDPILFPSPIDSSTPSRGIWSIFQKSLKTRSSFPWSSIKVLAKPPKYWGVSIAPLKFYKIWIVSTILHILGNYLRAIPWIPEAVKHRQFRRILNNFKLPKPGKLQILNNLPVWLKGEAMRRDNSFCRLYPQFPG